MTALAGATLIGAIALGTLAVGSTRGAPFHVTSVLWTYLLTVTAGALFVPALADSELRLVLAVGLLAFAGGVAAAELAVGPGGGEGRRPATAAPADLRAFRAVLLAATGLSIALTAWHLRRYGVPLLAGTWYTTGLEATSGLADRMFYALGPGALLLWSLAWYHLHRVDTGTSGGHRLDLALAVLALAVHLGHGVALGSKGTPVIAVVAVVLYLHHVHRAVRPGLLVALAAGGGTLLGVVLLYHVGLRGGAAAVELLAHRVFVVPTENLTWLVGAWSEQHGFFWGETVLMELRRIAHHAGLASQAPLYNQLLPALQAGAGPPADPGLLSAEYTVVGAGYANAGWWGAAAAGVLAGWIAEVGARALRRRTLGPLAGVGAVTLMLALLATVRTGNLLISLETWATTQALPLLLLAGVYRLVAGAAGRAAWAQDAG